MKIRLQPKHPPQLPLPKVEQIVICQLQLWLSNKVFLYPQKKWLRSKLKQKKKLEKLQGKLVLLPKKLHQQHLLLIYLLLLQQQPLQPLQQKHQQPQQHLKQPQLLRQQHRLHHLQLSVQQIHLQLKQGHKWLSFKQIWKQICKQQNKREKIKESHFRFKVMILPVNCKD